jgi:glycosyltransferase involved in cell wall biosynthesis
MKILYVVVAASNTPPSIQHEDSVAAVAPRQLKQGLERQGIEVDYFPVAGTFSRMNYLKACWKMFRLSLGGALDQYDLIHAHYGYNGIVARCQFRRPVLVSFMGSDVYRRWEQRLAWLLARMVTAVHVPGGQMCERINFPAEVIPYGTDLDIFFPTDQAQARQRLGLPADKKLVLFPYNPERVYHKRPDMIEGAVKQIEGAEMIAVFGKPPQVVAQYMNACDVMAMASSYEGSPVAIREALACNLPIVSVDVADVKVHLEGVCGCYMCERNSDDMAAKLRLVFADGQRLKDGRERVLNLSLDASAARMLEFYKRIL